MESFFSNESIKAANRLADIGIASYLDNELEKEVSKFDDIELSFDRQVCREIANKLSDGIPDRDKYCSNNENERSHDAASSFRFRRHLSVGWSMKLGVNWQKACYLPPITRSSKSLFWPAFPSKVPSIEPSSDGPGKRLDRFA